MSFTLRNINPQAAHQRHLQCVHCDKPAPETGHKPGLDCVRFICGECVDAAVRPHGRSLHFPHDEQDEFLLTPGFQPSAFAPEVLP